MATHRAMTRLKLPTFGGGIESNSAEPAEVIHNDKTQKVKYGEGREGVNIRLWETSAGLPEPADAPAAGDLETCATCAGTKDGGDLFDCSACSGPDYHGTTSTPEGSNVRPHGWGPKPGCNCLGCIKFRADQKALENATPPVPINFVNCPACGVRIQDYFVKSGKCFRCNPPPPIEWAMCMQCGFTKADHQIIDDRCPRCREGKPPAVVVGGRGEVPDEPYVWGYHATLAKPYSSNLQPHDWVPKTGCDCRGCRHG